MRCRVIITFILIAISLTAHTQTPQERYETFRKQARGQYDDFRSRANKQYADFVKQAWRQYHSMKAVPMPFEKPVPPVICPEEDKNKERKDEKKPFEEVVVVEPPMPQPQPVEPVRPVSPTNPVEPIKPKRETISIHFFGTAMLCTVATRPQFTLSSLSEEALSEAWQQLSDGQCDELLNQCLELRSHHQLNDWGYILLLDSISQSCFLQNNKATLLLAWLYCQSGYKMRLAHADGRLYMLFASENIIYKHNWFAVDGERFYPYKGEKQKELYVCGASFPKEQSMTLSMSAEPLLANRISHQRTLQSRRYPQIHVTTTVNKSLIDFYGGYPTGHINDDFGTRWAIYANTPLSHEARQWFYPQLQKLLQGKSELQATEELLNFVQTAFVYQYDDTVWGEDRAFFPEETIFYPYADCEDRSILFSRLVRDLLNLHIVLLYYPGHLATAVRFEEEQPTGDYLELDDGRYYIADPTYIGAPVGMSMPQVRDLEITVIRL